MTKLLRYVSSAGVSGFPSHYLPMILLVFLGVEEPDDVTLKLVVAEVVGGCCMKKLKSLIK
jgi:hypothetical protein